MAENKKGFILYSDLISVVEKLVLKDRENKTNLAGELFLHILKYVNDLNPVATDFIIEMAFEPIKMQLKRDLDKWETGVAKKSESGIIGNLKRWNNDIYLKYLEGGISLEEAIVEAASRKVSQGDGNQSQPIAKVAVNVNATVNDKEKVIKKEDIVARKLKFSATLKPFLEKYGAEMLNDFYKHWTEPNKSKTKLRFEDQKYWDIAKRLATWFKNQKFKADGKTPAKENELPAAPAESTGYPKKEA